MVGTRLKFQKFPSINLLWITKNLMYKVAPSFKLLDSTVANRFHVALLVGSTWDWLYKVLWQPPPYQKKIKDSIFKKCIGLYE